MCKKISRYIKNKVTELNWIKKFVGVEFKVHKTLSLLFRESAKKSSFLRGWPLRGGRGKPGH